MPSSYQDPEIILISPRLVISEQLYTTCWVNPRVFQFFKSRIKMFPPVRLEKVLLRHGKRAESFAILSSNRFAFGQKRLGNTIFAKVALGFIIRIFNQFKWRQLVYPNRDSCFFQMSSLKPLWIISILLYIFFNALRGWVTLTWWNFQKNTRAKIVG